MTDPEITQILVDADLFMTSIKSLVIGVSIWLCGLAIVRIIMMGRR